MGGVFAESDMDSLAELAKANGIPLKVLSAARDVNHTLAERLVEKIALALNSVETRTWEFLAWRSSRIQIRWRVPPPCGWLKRWWLKARGCGLMTRWRFPKPSCG